MNLFKLIIKINNFENLQIFKGNSNVLKEMDDLKCVSVEKTYFYRKSLSQT